MKITSVVTTVLVALLSSHVLDAAAQGVARAPSAMPSGLYVQVLDGQIALSNSAGSTNFTAGQFGYTPSIKQPPVIVPTNPGVQFTPPPAFNPSTQPAAASTTAKSNSVDCEVR